MKEKKRSIENMQTARQELSHLQDENKHFKTKIKQLTTVIERFKLRDDEITPSSRRNRNDLGHSKDEAPGFSGRAFPMEICSIKETSDDEGSGSSSNNSKIERDLKEIYMDPFTYEPPLENSSSGNPTKF